MKNDKINIFWCEGGRLFIAEFPGWGHGDKDLFKKVNVALKVYTVYTSELDESDMGAGESDILMKDRLAKGREGLDNALESLALICEPVEPPKGELQHIHFFCGNSEIPEELVAREPLRSALYKSTAMLVRAYSGVADALDALPLLELIVKSGIAEAINNLPEGIKSSRDAIAETIENNVRSKIIKDHLNDPAFYDCMSLLLDELIASRRRKAIDYEAYLKRIAELANRVASGHAEKTPAQLNTHGRRVLYNNLRLDRVGNVDLDFPDDPTAYQWLQDNKLRLAMMIDETVKRVRPDGWRGVKPKENIIKGALFEVLQDADEVERLFLVIERQREY